MKEESENGAENNSTKPKKHAQKSTSCCPNPRLQDEKENKDLLSSTLLRKTVSKHKYYKLQLVINAHVANCDLK